MTRPKRIIFAPTRHPHRVPGARDGLRRRGVGEPVRRDLRRSGRRVSQGSVRRGRDQLRRHL